MATEGFASIPNWLIRDARLSMPAIMVYVALASHTGQGGIHPSHRVLAEEARCSPRRVADALNELRDAGVISWRQEFHELGGQKTNSYYLLPQGGGSAVADGGGLQHVHTPPARAADEEEPHEEEPHEEENTLVQIDESETIDGMFDRAWSHWPKRVERKAALAKFKLAAKRRGLERITADVIRFGDAYTAAEPDPRFVPALSGWLNGERWVEDLPAPRRAQPRITNARRNLSTVEHFRQLEQKEIGR